MAVPAVVAPTGLCTVCLLVSGNLPISLVGPESLSCEIGFILFGWSVNQKEKEMIAN